MALATVFAYSPALHGSFIWDDDSWTTGIAKLLKDGSGLVTMWTDPTALQQYYPLTGTSFWVDHQLWKDWTFPYHFENVGLHLLAAFLFWRLLLELEVPGAWLAAGIFALHPMMVESVAWITERKNVLSMCLFLAALLAYGKANSFWQVNQRSHKKEPSKPEGTSKRTPHPYSLSPFSGERETARDVTKTSCGLWLYWFALVLFTGALLAKTVTCSFPAVVLLIVWWKNGRISWRKDVLPSLPFFAIALIGSALTAWLEKSHVGAQGWEWEMSFPERCLVAGRAFWFYPAKLLWPENLCFLYPRWKADTGALWQWLLPLTALGVFPVLWACRHKIGRGPLTVALFYLGTIFPVLGFMNAYGARYSFVWDHWFYLSSIGLIAIGAALITTLARSRPRILAGLAVVLLPLLGWLTWQQSAMYANSEILWRTTIAKNPNAFLALNNLGYVLMQRNELPEAIADFQQSIAANPGFNESHNNLGDAYLRTGRTNEAMAEFRKAIDLISKDTSLAAASYYNYGNALLETGNPDEAVTYYEKSLKLLPGYARAQNNLGVAFLRTGQTNEAMASFRRALQSSPGFEDAFNNLVELLVTDGNIEEAIHSYQEELRHNDSAALHEELAELLAKQNRIDEAISHYETAVKLAPDEGEFQFNLGMALMSKNRLDDAAGHFQRAIDLIPDSAQSDYRLGLVHQIQKKFGPALGEYQKALDLDPNYIAARNNLVWILATCPEASLRDGKRAVALAEQVNADYRNSSPQFLDTLSAAYAEAGRFTEATATIQRAIELATGQGDAALATELKSRYKLYTANVAFHEAE